jgi:hypothetical protein
MTRWNASHPDIANDRRVVLPGDTVSFRPRVTIADNGSVEGLEDIRQLESPDLFEQYLLGPKAFTAFLTKHWSITSSAIFAFQIQPVLPSLPCCIVHAWPRRNGKGNEKIVTRLFDRQAILESRFGFQVIGLAFDSDSAYSELRQTFKQQCEARLPMEWNRTVIRLLWEALVGICAIIYDPKHMAKRVRYRFVSGEFWVGIGIGPVDILFSLERIEKSGILRLTVFDKTRITKMHNVLPIRLFSPVRFHVILTRGWKPELVLSPWCLLTSSLTYLPFNTKSRCELFETGYFFLKLYEKLMAQTRLAHGVTQKIINESVASLYSNNQLRDALNTFASLISIIRESPTPVNLGNLGSDPFKHSFGHARARCRDVNTMVRMLRAFADKAEEISSRQCLELLNMPRGRHAMGIICGPGSESPDSELICSPYEIAVQLLEEVGLDLTPILGAEPPSSPDAPAWHCLLKLPVFSGPVSSRAFKGTLFAFMGNLRRNYGNTRIGGFYLQISSFWGL